MTGCLTGLSLNITTQIGHLLLPNWGLLRRQWLWSHLWEVSMAARHCDFVLKAPRQNRLVNSLWTLSERQFPVPSLREIPGKKTIGLCGVPTTMDPARGPSSLHILSSATVVPSKKAILGLLVCLLQIWLLWMPSFKPNQVNFLPI